MKNFKAQLQKLGRSMLLPVAAMPLAGLILRISADDMLNIAILGAAGNAVFNNLDFLFAIGVALGFAKAKDKGIPALTAFLSMATLKAGLIIIDPSINMGIFGGIISGLAAAWTYNKFKNQNLPIVLSYFAKEKFPLTMVLIIQTFVSIVCGYVWPIMESGIDAFARLLVGLGPIGVGLFTGLNRLLIPFGLHHVINSYIYFDLGTFENASGEILKGEVTRFINGDPSAGLFLSGFFVVMMFGVPAICLAIYKAAKAEKKEMVKGVMAGGAATSFISNITEPIEFSFMFISPMLYVIHSILAGLAGVVCALLDIRLGFTFGACIVDYLINFNLGKNAILILPVGIIFFFIYFFIFYFLITKRNIKTLGRESEETFSEEKESNEANLSLKSKNYEYMAKKLLNAFGGKANIEDAFSCNTRLRIEVKDSSLVDERRIKQTGVSGLVKPSDKNYQVIIGLEVTYVFDEFQKIMDNEKVE